MRGNSGRRAPRVRGAMALVQTAHTQRWGVHRSGIENRRKPARKLLTPEHSGIGFPLWLEKPSDYRGLMLSAVRHLRKELNRGARVRGRSLHQRRGRAAAVWRGPEAPTP